jgi:hypothetical protein
VIGSNVRLSVITGVTIIVNTSSSGSARMLSLAVRTVHLLLKFLSETFKKYKYLGYS